MREGVGIRSQIGKWVYHLPRSFQIVSSESPGEIKVKIPLQSGRGQQSQVWQALIQSLWWFLLNQFDTIQNHSKKKKKKSLKKWLSGSWWPGVYLWWTVLNALNPYRKTWPESGWHKSGARGLGLGMNRESSLSTTGGVFKSPFLTVDEMWPAPCSSDHLDPSLPSEQ